MSLTHSPAEWICCLFYCHSQGKLNWTSSYHCLSSHSSFVFPHFAMVVLDQRGRRAANHQRIRNDEWLVGQQALVVADEVEPLDARPECETDGFRVQNEGAKWACDFLLQIVPHQPISYQYKPNTIIETYSNVVSLTWTYHQISLSFRFRVFVSEKNQNEMISDSGSWFTTRFYQNFRGHGFLSTFAIILHSAHQIKLSTEVQKMKSEMELFLNSILAVWKNMLRFFCKDLYFICSNRYWYWHWYQPMPISLIIDQQFSFSCFLYQLCFFIRIVVFVWLCKRYAVPP